MHNPPLCQLWELHDGGRYTLDDLADFHEAIDVEEENERRYRAAAQEQERQK
jgi:hypothetical protein